MPARHAVASRGWGRRDRRDGRDRCHLRNRRNGRDRRHLRDRRNAKQPLELPSAGSTFKRPQGNFAGKLIQEAGLAGFTIGGAQVSPKHCGFVVNIGEATSADIKEMIDTVRQRVFENSGVMLEPEVKMLGEF